MKLKLLNKILLITWLFIIVVEYIYNHFILGGPGILENMTFGLSILLQFILFLFFWYQERNGFKVGFIVIEGLLFLGGTIFVVSAIFSSQV